ncbi:acyl-CoA dehydrogenase family protein [Tsuneonella sp. HG249]
MQSVVNLAPINWQARAEDVAEAVAECAARHDAEDSFVAEGYARLKAAGLFSALVPAELGGGGASLSTIAECIRIIGRSCGSTALAFSMHSHLVAVAAWRREHQGAPTEAMLKRVASEGLVLVSTGGNDWLSSGGSAVKVEGGFRVTARKPFASGSVMGDLVNTSVLYEDPEAGPTVLHFAVPMSAEGVTIEPTWQVMGMRGTGSNDIVLDDVFVSDAGIAGRRPAGEWHMLFHVICKMAFALIYSAYLGVAEGARDIAVGAAGKRAPNPLTALLAGELENDLMIARLSHEHALSIAEEWKPGPETTSAAMQCRQITGRHAISAVSKALELAGGSAFYRRGALERMFRDIQAARFHPLQDKPQLVMAGEVALGWPISA